VIAATTPIAGQVPDPDRAAAPSPQLLNNFSTFLRAAVRDRLNRQLSIVSLHACARRPSGIAGYDS
jgi:predicted nucleic acid-binding Zn ribbon protein